MSTRPSARKPAGAATLQADVTDAIVAAALDEFAEKGYLGMSVDGVARRAGVGKSAIYRRWPSKQEMAIAVLAQMSSTDRPVPDQGSLQADVRAALREVRTWLGDPRMRRIFPDVLAEGMRNKTMAQALTTSIERPRRLRGMEILERAVRRGEMDPDADKELILDLMGANVFWRLVALRRKVTDADLDKIADVVVAQAQRPTA